MSSRWVRTVIVAAGFAGAAFTLSALDSDPAAAADRPPPATVDRAERTIDRALDRPDREFPPRVLPRHHRPPSPPGREDPADRPPLRKPRPATPAPAPVEPDRGETSPPTPGEPPTTPAPEPDDQDPVERPTPPAEPVDPSTPPATPEPTRPREPILDVPPIDVGIPPLIPPTSPAVPEPVPTDPAPAEPAPVDTPPAPPALPAPPARPAPVVEFDPTPVASPRAGPSGRPRPARDTVEHDSGDRADRHAVDPCDHHHATRMPPRRHRAPAPAIPASSTRRPGQCPDPGHSAWTDSQVPPGVKPPDGGAEQLILGTLTATSSPALTRITVARARGHLDGRPAAALDPRPA
ncbi:hypothetical protein ACQSSU_06495 [Micromonospora echinospora]